MRTLIIPVKGVYFAQIKAGTKPREYRQTTPYWRKRIEGQTYDRLVLTLGYPNADDRERRLVLPWRGYQIEKITHPHFGPVEVEVFAIDVTGKPA